MNDIFQVDWMYNIDEIKRPEFLVTKLHLINNTKISKQVKIIICDSGDPSITTHPPNLPEHIKTLYTANCDIPPSKRYVGIPYGTLKAQTKIIEELNIPKEKIILAYCNFGIGSHRSRPQIWKQMLSKDYVVCEHPERNTTAHIDAMPNYFSKLSSSKFAICPRGNGPDTYRMWEAWMVGSIPIVLNTPLIDHFKDSMPILIIDDYNQLTESFLNIQYDIIKHKQYTYDVMKKTFWINKWLQQI